MPYRIFFSQLVGLTFGLVILALLSGWYPPMAVHQGIFWISILFFFFLSILTYWLADRAARSDNKFAFTHVSIIFLFGKLMFSIILLVVYKKIAAPESSLFVIPFFLVYLCFTVFETSFLMKLGRINNQSEQQ